MVTLDEIIRNFEDRNENVTAAFWGTVDSLNLGTDEVGVNDKYYLGGILEESDLEVWAIADNEVIIFDWSVVDGGWEALDIGEWLERVEKYIENERDGDFSEYDKHWTR